MKDILNYILLRLKERSTWLGLISLATAAGVTLSPDQTQAVVTAGVGLAGVIAVFTKDMK